MALFARLRAWAKIIKRDGLTLWFAARHPQVPRYAKVLGFVVVGYALSPIDLIPDFIPVLGMLDDLILLPILIAATLRLIPSILLMECRASADQWIREMKGKLVSRTGAAVIIVIWLTIAVAVWRNWIGPWIST